MSITKFFATSFTNWVVRMFVSFCCHTLRITECHKKVITDAFHFLKTISLQIQRMSENACWSSLFISIAYHISTGLIKLLTMSMCSCTYVVEYLLNWVITHSSAEWIRMIILSLPAGFTISSTSVVLLFCFVMYLYYDYLYIVLFQS